MQANLACHRRLQTKFNGWGDIANQSYITESSDHFELIRTIPARWNRVIFYDSGIFHSGHITNPELLKADPAAGRLTLNGFFTCQKAAG